jgi:hypothetical protein
LKRGDVSAIRSVISAALIFVPPDVDIAVACEASEEPVKWIDGSRADFYQNVIVTGRRFFNVFTPENIGRAVV